MTKVTTNSKVYLLGFVETPRKFIIAELSIRKLGSSSVLIIPQSLTSILYSPCKRTRNLNSKVIEGSTFLAAVLLLWFQSPESGASSPPPPFLLCAISSIVHTTGRRSSTILSKPSRRAIHLVSQTLKFHAWKQATKT